MCAQPAVAVFLLVLNNPAVQAFHQHLQSLFSRAVPSVPPATSPLMSAATRPPARAGKLSDSDFAPVPDRALDPNVQTCAQVMALQLHRKVQKMNLTKRNLTKMLYDYSLFWEGVWMRDMGSQAREAMRIRFGPASVPAPALPIKMDDVCEQGIR